MIAREWRCLCPRRHREGFLKHLERTGVREALATPGCRGYQILERYCTACPTGLSGSIELGLVTYWESWEAVRAFAGPDPEHAVLYPGDERFEIVPDRHVRHDEVLELEMK
ncbi:MAG: antibiotic biosynthesis monooxygenase [Proteobacteria bacterium]|nr:antibiotic biosynthesis monooxygenase [Pseudomonadota bacterium]MBU1595005.1 antibiotic biosynthesis monooxygenase [Pseudomonadota bacterium]